MEIRSGEYDFPKYHDTITREEYIKSHSSTSATIFDYIDCMDGHENGVALRSNIENIFSSIEYNIKDNTDVNFSNNELTCPSELPTNVKKTSKNMFKAFVKDLKNTGIKADNKSKGYFLGNTVKLNNGRTARVISPDNVRQPVNLLNIYKGMRDNRNIGMPNGEIENFSQGNLGDCYLITEINSIKQTMDGDKILRKNIKKSKDGVIVTLPGAIETAEKRKKSGKKSEITGIYYIPLETLEQARKLAGASYANGDMDVIALELAIEAYHAEAQNALKKSAAGVIEKLIGKPLNFRKDYISGGHAEEVEYLLTGISKNLSVKKKHTMLFDDDKYKRISRAELAKIPSDKPISRKEESKISKCLNFLQNKEKFYALKWSATCAKKGKDGVTRAGSNHALTVLKITNDYVYVENPWHLQDEKSVQVIPRKEFEAMTNELRAGKMDLKTVNENYKKILKLNIPLITDFWEIF